MRNQGTGSWIARRAARTPGRIAVIHGDTAFSYAALHARTTRLAHALRSLGVGAGDRVAYLGPNHPSYLETLFAAWTLGAVFVPVNSRLAPPEVAHQLTDCGARVLIQAPSQSAGHAAMDVITVGQSYDDLLASGNDVPIDEDIAQQDPALIMYTSGTTGQAKGATLTHGNVLWNAINCLVDADFRADEVSLVVAPLFHTAALNMLSLPTILKGGTLVVEAAFDPGRALDVIERHRVTCVFGVPAMFDAIAGHDRWTAADLSSLRTLLCGGAPVPEATIRTWLGRGLTFIQGYGMTEAGPGSLLLDAEHVVSKAGSAGIPHFFTDVTVARQDLTPCAPGETGEIVVSGPNVMRGYWGQPEPTAAVLAEGPDGRTWLRSGDAGTTDADGYVTVVDRIKDMIISGGENIYPAEVESAFYDHPDVIECGVIGVPDARWGEVGRAIVVLKPGALVTEADLIGWLGGRIARYKIPKSVRFTSALPRSGAGKILRKQLRDSYGEGDARS